MENLFFTLQEFMTHTKAAAYLLMGGALIGLLMFWRFLTGRDEKKRTF
jgi:hypothetical protein